MEIAKTIDGSKLTLGIEGRLDTTTAPQLEELLKNTLTGITELEFNMAKLEYISSAGLRTLLLAQKTMNKQGKMIVKNCGEGILEVFEITGFSDILTIA